MAAPYNPYQGAYPAAPGGPAPAQLSPYGAGPQLQQFPTQAQMLPMQGQPQSYQQQFQQFQQAQQQPQSQPNVPPATQPAQPGSRLQDNRPAPIVPPSSSATPAAPVRRGLFDFFRRGFSGRQAQGQGQEQAAAQPAQQQGAGQPSGNPDDPEAGPRPSQGGSEAPPGEGGADGAQEGEAGGPQGQAQPKSLMQSGAPDKDIYQVAMVSYENSYTHREEAPAVTESIQLQFDVSRLGGAPQPLPARTTAMQEGRFAREELGLYRERQCVLSEHSLNKMEQRIVKATTLDKALLAEMAGGNTAAAQQQVANIMAQRQEQQQQQQQLQVGALPTVAEEPEGPGEGQPEAPPANLLILPPADANAAAQQQQQQAQQQQMQQSQQQQLLQQQMQQQLVAAGVQAPGTQSTAAPALLDPHAAAAGAGGALMLPPGMPGAGPPLPGTIPIQDPLFAYQWLDENGLMVYVPNPLKPDRERPARRYDQDKEMTRTYVRRPVKESASSLLTGHRLYRLDVELGRLEFLVHPAMGQEDLLAARLLALFREFKRREAVGLVMFYANRLAALEDSMLGAREKLFALQATEAPLDDILDSYAMLAKIEREVAEMRQLKEEEEALLARTVRSMERLYGNLQVVRQQQGYALTNLELTVQTRPPQEVAWKQGVLTRDRLDALLVAAELEDIAGLPAFPSQMPVPDLADLPLTRGGPPPPQLPGPGSMGGFGFGAGGWGPMGQPLPPPGPGVRDGPPLFRLRRVESMCACHTAIVADLTARLEAIQNRPSADPSDPELLALEQQAALVGRAPRRVSMTEEEQVALQQRANEMCKEGQIFVHRIPQLVPFLTIRSPDSDMAALQQQHRAAMLQQQQQQHQQQQQQLYAPGQPPPLGPAGSPGMAPGAPGQPLPQGTAVPIVPPPPPKPTHKQGGKGRYYVKLYVNGHYVDSSDVASLGDNFVGDLKDVFSIQVSRWPQSICIQLFERHTLRDTYIGQVFAAIPGVGGTPHIDAVPRPYQFTALSPFRPRLQPGAPGPMPLMPEGPPEPGTNYHAVFPAGTIYVRCGWVSEHVEPGTRLADAAAPAMLTYDNPLADRPDIESGKVLMPPQPRIPVDRMLRRAAERIGGKANRVQIMRWLAEHIIDPNDPRNAPLLELLKTHEASSGLLGDLFRLDIFPDVAMRDDRTAEKRMKVLARRWQTGIYRAPDKNLLKGVRSVALRAPLSTEETAHLDNQYLDQLALLEEAGGGTQLALARVMMARHEKAMQLQIGALLSSAIKEREERIRAFALRVRAAGSRLAAGRTMARRFRTEDVVNDAPLPQFKLELATLTQLLAPRRPLKRSKKLIKSLMTSVPRETQLMVTIQRASNLPSRITEAAGLEAAGARGGRPAARRARFEDDDEERDSRDRDRDRRDRDRDRERDKERRGPSGSPEEEAKTRNCFVEVRFRSIARRTETVPGEFPIFNEQIDLDVFRDDGADRQQQGVEEGSGLEPSPSALQENSDLITLNVFDEIIVERAEPVTSRRRADDVSDPVRLPERERRFLGCVHVPLSAVYQLQVLEGTFKIEAPPVVLGYVQTSDRPSTLSFYMTLRPRLAAPTGELEERVTSGEQEEVNRHTQRWLAALLARPDCRSRVHKVMAVDADGAAVLVCRYVCPVPLPPNLAQLVAGGGAAAEAGGVEALMLKLARFVSHLPYMEDTGIQKRRTDVWTSNAEFLHLSAGDFEEHAHLLAGYFMQLGLQTFVVLGTSLCGARSAFVLTTGVPLPPPGQPQAAAPALDLNPALLRLWNPVTGSVVSAKDVTGEMREVGQLYDGNNIWANVQPTGRPWEMRWNLAQQRDWVPFFGQQLPPREVASIQSAPIYEEMDVRFYELLEGRVEKRVEEALGNARAAGSFVTRPDNKVSRLLKSLLREMPKASEAIAAASLAASAALADSEGKGPTEAPAYLGKRHELIAGLQASHNMRIKREAKAEAAHGHILALPFSDRYLEAVNDAVLNTGIYRIADDRVKFSTAVFVEPLGASFVCCIWVYVAAIRG